MTTMLELLLAEWRNKKALRNRLTKLVYDVSSSQVVTDSAGYLKVEVKKQRGERTLAIRIILYADQAPVTSKQVEELLKYCGYNEALVRQKSEIREGDTLFIVDY